MKYWPLLHKYRGVARAERATMRYAATEFDAINCSLREVYRKKGRRTFFDVYLHEYASMKSHGSEI